MFAIHFLVFEPHTSWLLTCVVYFILPHSYTWSSEVILMPMQLFHQIHFECSMTLGKWLVIAVATFVSPFFIPCLVIIIRTRMYICRYTRIIQWLNCPSWSWRRKRKVWEWQKLYWLSRRMRRLTTDLPALSYSPLTGGDQATFIPGSDRGFFRHPNLNTCMHVNTQLHYILWWLCESINIYVPQCRWF